MNIQQHEIAFLRNKELVIKPIYKGYSEDHKFVVEDGQNKYLLRTFDSIHMEQKQLEYAALSEMKRLSVKCSRPLEFGTIPSKGIGYMLLTYIEGRDALEELPSCSRSEQYQVGFEAGEELRKIHLYTKPAAASTWYEDKLKKHQRYMEKYRFSSVRIPYDTAIASFIEDHLALMKHRPNVFQHDDFHAGNLIMQEKRLAGVIDFNRFDWGDPDHEFLKLGMFSVETSVPFSIGLIRGYFKQEPDELFWKRYALYQAMCMFSSIVWIQQVKPEETEQMLERLNRVIEDHHGFEYMRPNWYSEYSE